MVDRQHERWGNAVISCQAKGCQEQPVSLVAVVYPEGKEWRFCRVHFWHAVHAVLNRGAERVIVKYPAGARLTPLIRTEPAPAPEPTP